MSKNIDCADFMADQCTKGDECEFRHSDAAKANPSECVFFRNARCLKQDCPFRHTRLHSAMQTQPSVPCKFFMMGTCQRGRSCPFDHNLNHRKFDPNAPKAPPASASASTSTSALTPTSATVTTAASSSVSPHDSTVSVSSAMSTSSDTKPVGGADNLEKPHTTIPRTSRPVGNPGQPIIASPYPSSASALALANMGAKKPFRQPHKHNPMGPGQMPIMPQMGLPFPLAMQMANPAFMGQLQHMYRMNPMLMAQQMQMMAAAGMNPALAQLAKQDPNATKVLPKAQMNKRAPQINQPSRQDTDGIAPLPESQRNPLRKPHQPKPMDQQQTTHSSSQRKDPLSESTNAEAQKSEPLRVRSLQELLGDNFDAAKKSTSANKTSTSTLKVTMTTVGEDSSIHAPQQKQPQQPQKPTAHPLASAHLLPPAKSASGMRCTLTSVKPSGTLQSKVSQVTAVDVQKENTSSKRKEPDTHLAEPAESKKDRSYEAEEAQNPEGEYAQEGEYDEYAEGEQPYNEDEQAYNEDGQPYDEQQYDEQQYDEQQYGEQEGGEEYQGEDAEQYGEEGAEQMLGQEAGADGEFGDGLEGTEGVEGLDAEDYTGEYDGEYDLPENPEGEEKPGDAQ